ncbi:DUF2795 domain-containing protein [Streptomyces sp. NPDC003077]|uniref:DUF2795 domain-containing protein n=1 Tax=Streptomyces sp. NPDC003077 TaxID=3154443 RepID=UPI0033AAFDAD
MAAMSPIDLQKALKGAHYPAKKKDLVDCAKHNKAKSQVVDTISGLKENDFDGPNDVQKAVFHNG